MKPFRRFLLAAAALLLLATAAAPLWLPVLGWIPVEAANPRHTDAALIPTPDFASGAQAIHAAADLVRAGYVRRVLVDSGQPYYGRTVCDYWIPQLADARGFECFTVDSDDVVAHFRYAAGQVRGRGVQSVLVIAPERSSRRYRRMMEQFLGGSLPVYLYVTPSPAYSPQTWWKSREGRKIWLIETFKLALTYQPFSFLQSLL